MISLLESAPSLIEQASHLMNFGCKNTNDSSTCQGFVKDSWSDLGVCLYNQPLLKNMICEHFGGCEHNSHVWECEDIGSLVTRVLNNSPFILLGVENHIYDCFCQNDPDCKLKVHWLMPSLLPVLSSWISQKVDWICANGESTCSQCMTEAGEKKKAQNKLGLGFAKLS